MIPTGRQVRDGRALVGMSQADLAEAAGVRIGLVVRVEQRDGMAITKKVDSAAIMRALEIAGVEFVREDTAGPSVRLRKTAAP